MKYNKGCMVCGKELVYTQELSDVTCEICGEKYDVDVKCPDGHYVCDSCHNKSGNEFIIEYCSESKETDPLAIVYDIMKNPSINLHGPEHHYLVPAALITAYYNKIGDQKLKEEKLAIAKERASYVKGGLCGNYGACGAAIGSGIFASVITEATPLTEETWGFANKMTGSILMDMGEIGGPRCCKRNTFLSVIKAAENLYNENGIKLLDFENVEPFCEYKAHNKQCIKERCPYFLNRR